MAKVVHRVEDGISQGLSWFFSTALGKIETRVQAFFRFFAAKSQLASLSRNVAM